MFRIRVQENRSDWAEQTDLKSLALLHAAELVTLAGPQRPRIGSELSDLGIIRDGGLLIHDGKIDIVGPSDEIEKAAGDAEIIDLGGRPVVSGFVGWTTPLGF